MPKNDSSVVNYDARAVNWSSSICGLLYPPLRSSETTCQRDYGEINLISQQRNSRTFVKTGLGGIQAPQLLFHWCL